MALQTVKQVMEIENLIGMKYIQTLVRAETLVPGAGREAIEPLMAEATLFINEIDLQTDRIVIEGAVDCQAIYRQGEETTVRALAAKSSLNQVIEIQGTTAEMFARVKGEVEHVDVKYENGHMIFMITCGLKAQVMQLLPVEVIQSVTGAVGLETAYKEICSVKLAAEAGETALLKETIPLPAALDARTSLMDWATVDIEETLADLGGIRVKGKVMLEILVSSGVQGRPAVLVRYPVAFDQLVEIPEWLTENVFVDGNIKHIKTQVEQAEGDDDAKLNVEVEMKINLIANAKECAEALADIYATEGNALTIEMEQLELCASAERIKITDTVRGTVMIGENAPGVGTIIAAHVRPVIGEYSNENGRGKIEGVLEATVLYMPGGSDSLASAQSELPFSLDVPIVLTDDSWISIQVTGAEANALMSDRLEMKVQMNISCETRRRESYQIVKSIEESDKIVRKSGILLYWPDAGEDKWSVGKRYAIPADDIENIQHGKPVIMKV